MFRTFECKNTQIYREGLARQACYTRIFAGSALFCRNILQLAGGLHKNKVYHFHKRRIRLISSPTERSKYAVPHI